MSDRTSIEWTRGDDGHPEHLTTASDGLRASYTQTCPDCGFTSKATRTPGYASQAIQNHSCERHLKQVAAAARRRARTRAIDRTPKQCFHPLANHQHGTYACYNRDGCRCIRCAATASEYNKRRARSNAYGRADLVDAGHAREHLRMLQAAGLGLRAIVVRTGVSHGAIVKLLYGEAFRNVKPTARVHRATEQRILATPPPTPTELPGGALVDGTGTRRRLQALARIGWTAQAIATRADLQVHPLRYSINGRLTVTAHTAAAVAAVYNELWSIHGTGPGSKAVRRRAEREEWPPPMAWDNIDDPQEQPSGVRTAQSNIQDELAEQLGVTQRTVTRTRRAS